MHILFAVYLVIGHCLTLVRTLVSYSELLLLVRKMPNKVFLPQISLPWIIV